MKMIQEMLQIEQDIYFLMQDYHWDFPRGLSYKFMMNALKKPRTTIVDNVWKLFKKGVVEKESFKTGFRGRPITLWKLKLNN